MILLPVQCRMARAALGLGVRQLAAAAKVSIDTIARFERGEELKERTIDALQRALEAAGVEFTNGDQPGVRLSRAAAAQSTQPRRGSNPPVVTKAAPRRTRSPERIGASRTASVGPRRAAQPRTAARRRRAVFQTAWGQFMDTNRSKPNAILPLHNTAEGAIGFIASGYAGRGPGAETLSTGFQTR